MGVRGILTALYGTELMLYWLGFYQLAQLSVGKALLLASIASLVLRVIFVLANFALAQWQRRRWSAHPIVKGRVQDWAAMMIREGWAFFYLYTWAQWLPKSWLPLASRHQSNQLVILVHGYFCNQGFWRPLAVRLAASGYRVWSVEQPNPFAAIETLTDPLRVRIQDALKNPEIDTVQLVGFSMGGLAIRQALGQLHQQQVALNKLAQVITLNTPHEGTAMAITPGAENNQQMQPRATWRQKLPALPSNIPWQVVYSQHDNIVSPPELGHWQTDQQNVHWWPRPFQGHVAIALDKNFHNQILTWLKEKSVGLKPALDHQGRDNEYQTH